jgi:RNA polymerase sigma-70 factor (ECF subfamily)
VSATVSPVLDQLPVVALADASQTLAFGLREAPAGDAASPCGMATGTSAIYTRTEATGTERPVADDPTKTTDARMDALCDEELLRRYSDADDQMAFHSLYGRYRLRLHRFILRLSRDSHEAEEVFQETWLAVIRGIDKNCPVGRFPAYLFAIAHRRLVDRWRRFKRLAPFQTDGQSPCDPDEVADDFMVAPDEWTQHAQLQRALMTALTKLPVPQREVFLMKAEADLSLEEIAEIMGTTREAAKSRLRYALAHLRAALRNWK